MVFVRLLAYAAKSIFSICSSLHLNNSSAAKILVVALILPVKSFLKYSVVYPNISAAHDVDNFSLRSFSFTSSTKAVFSLIAVFSVFCMNQTLSAYFSPVKQNVSYWKVFQI